jgi:long-chain fatty acid transport protein
MHNLRSWCILVCLVVVAIALPATSEAQGFGVYEHSACAMGRGGATVADPCLDGSSMFFNPAGIAHLDNGVLNAGVTVIAAGGNFTHQETLETDDLHRTAIPVPTLYFAWPVKEKLALGLGIFAPYGLETEWPETAQGRFLGYNSKIAAIYVQPTVAYEVNDWLSLGGGLDINFVSVELKQHLDLSEQTVPGSTLSFAAFGLPNRTDFANAELTGHGTTWGFNLGAIAKATDWLSFGVRYLARQKANIEGGEVKIDQISTGLVIPVDVPLPTGTVPAGTPVDALVAPLFLDGQTLSDQSAATVLRFPEQLVIGTSILVSSHVKLLVDYQYTNWSVFESLPITFEHIGLVTLQEQFVETHGVRLGGEYIFNPDTQFRLGFLTHGAAAPAQTVTPNLPEGPRSEVTIGFGTRLWRGLRFDLAYQYIDQADRRGRSTDGGTDTPTAGVNDGLYQFDAHLVGLSLVYKF